MALIQAGAFLLPMVLTAFAGYRAGWPMAKIAATLAGTAAAMWVVVYRGMTQ